MPVQVSCHQCRNTVWGHSMPSFSLLSQWPAWIYCVWHMVFIQKALLHNNFDVLCVIGIGLLNTLTRGARTLPSRSCYILPREDNKPNCMESKETKFLLIQRDAHTINVVFDIFQRGDYYCCYRSIYPIANCVDRCVFVCVSLCVWCVRMWNCGGRSWKSERAGI